MSLPLVVEKNLKMMDEDSQQQFWEEYNKNKRTGGRAFLCWLCFCHHAYFKLWFWQVAFWLTGGGSGLWWVMSLFTLRARVREYNSNAAIEALKTVKALSISLGHHVPAPPPVPARRSA